MATLHSPAKANGKPSTTPVGWLVSSAVPPSGNPVEVFPEGMNRDAASFAEFGLGQAAAAEIVEEGVPAEVEDEAPRHGVISRAGLRAPAGK